VPREDAPPPWLEPRFVRESALDHRVEAGALPRGASSLADAEAEWYLTHPFFGRVNAMMGRLALEYGVELRSPLFDRRIVAFALARPRDERNRAGDKKRLLRRAMRGLLPDEVLAVRGAKTGTQHSFFYRGMREQVLPLLDSLSRDAALAELGIVSPRALAAAIADHRAGRTAAHTEELYATLQTELWLRARLGKESTSTEARSIIPAEAAHPAAPACITA
jgi:asparagine synthetase B (glutamine-hydrolysing)